jgi:hypothetical protein
VLITVSVFAAQSASAAVAEADVGETIEAVDWSMFQPAHTAEEMQRIKDGGVDLLILGSWHGDALGLNKNCYGDLALAHEAGLKTAIYVVVDGPGGTSPEDAVIKGLWACGRQAAHAQFIALDAEVESTTPELLKKAAYIVRLLGKEPIIYTARWFWEDTIGNPQEACDLPLWNALYDYRPDFNFDEYPYGCWTPDQVVGEQYSNESRFKGMEMDHNAFKVSFIDSLQPTLTPAASPSPSPTPTTSTTPAPTTRALPLAAAATNPVARPALRLGPICESGTLDVFESVRAGALKCTEPGHP